MKTETQIAPQDSTEMRATASKNLQALYSNSYFGRLVMMGLTLDASTVVIITAISGRSMGSKNRRYGYDAQTGRIYTEIADPSLETGDAELIIYDTQLEDHDRGIFAASNGRQTVDCLMSSKASLGKLLKDWTFEPDAPNNTPRISGRCITTLAMEPVFEFAIHRKIAKGKLQIETTDQINLDPGFALYLCTYEGDGNPLPSFIGGPRLVTMEDAFGKGLLKGLQSTNDYLVSLAVKRISLLDGATSISVWNKND